MLKALISANAQSDIQMMYTFINGLSQILRTKLMFKETASYEKAVTTAWKYYMAHSYEQDEYLLIVDTQTPMDLDKRARSRFRFRSITRQSTSDYTYFRNPRADFDHFLINHDSDHDLDPIDDFHDPDHDLIHDLDQDHLFDDNIPISGQNDYHHTTLITEVLNHDLDHIPHEHVHAAHDDSSKLIVIISAL